MPRQNKRNSQARRVDHHAAAILVMITYGWGIYNDNVIIKGLHFATE